MGTGSMEASEFFKQVKSYFRYLLDEYDFMVASEKAAHSADYAEIVLTSREWRVSIAREYGFVFIGVGSSTPDERGFYLSHVVAFLDAIPPSRAIGFSPKFNEFLDYSDRIQAQLRWWAETLRPYCDRIAGLFNKEVYAVKRPELVACSELIEREMRQELSHGGTIT